MNLSLHMSASAIIFMLYCFDFISSSSLFNFLFKYFSLLLSSYSLLVPLNFTLPLYHFFLSWCLLSCTFLVPAVLSSLQLSFQLLISHPSMLSPHPYVQPGVITLGTTFTLDRGLSPFMVYNVQVAAYNQYTVALASFMYIAATGVVAFYGPLVNVMTTEGGKEVPRWPLVCH